MKTIEQWFTDVLPQEVLEKAIYNTKTYSFPGRLKCEFHSFYDSINAAFVWSGTPEGFDYWFDIEKKYRDKK